jgi:hypothetical protein
VQGKALSYAASPATLWPCSGERRRYAAEGWDYEPSHCRHCVWLHAGRMFHNDAELGFSQVRSGVRDAGHRIRTARGRGENIIGSELSHALPARGPAPQRVFRDACAQRVPAADGVGASGRGGRKRCPAARAQSGSRHPAGGDAAEEAGCEEKEARGGSGPSGPIIADRLGSAGARTNDCACSCPAALIPSGGGSIRDQLSLAVTIILFGG